MRSGFFGRSGGVFPVIPMFIGSSIFNSITTPISLSKPAGSQSGDLLVVFIFTANSTSVVTGIPSGWTLQFEDNSTSNAFRIYTKISAPGETQPFTWTITGSGGMTASLLAYRNVSQIETFGTLSRVSIAPISAPGLTALSDGALIGLFAQEGSGGAPTAPDGMTMRAVYIAANPSIAVYDIIYFGPGYSGDKTITWPGSSSCAQILIHLS